MEKEKECIMKNCHSPGICGKETVDDTNFCKEHLELGCNIIIEHYPLIRCGKQSTHQCNGYNGSFVCGAPLCEEHKDCH